MECPECGEECTRDMVDVGVGEIPSGPFGCENCGWVEDDGEVEIEEREREKGDDDGVEYADPSDELAERRFDALFDWFIEGPK